MAQNSPKPGTAIGQRLGTVLTYVEDLIYIVLALGLIIAAVAVLSSAASDLLELFHGDPRSGVLSLLNDLLLVLLLIEILHTVGISLREHVLRSEAFLVVGLIAGIRRVLVITAEQPEDVAAEAVAFRLIMLELGLLTAMILVLVVSIYLLRRQKNVRQQHGPDVEPGKQPGTYVVEQPGGEEQELVTADEQEDRQEQSHTAGA